MSKKSRRRERQRRREAQNTNILDKFDSRLNATNEFGDVEKEFPYKTLVFSEGAYKKLLYYARAAKGEVSGLGRTVPEGDELWITEVLLFKQECSAGGTTLEADDLANFISQIAGKGRDPSEFKLWWHTHNDFGVFWSGTDEMTATRLGQKTLVASVCANKAGHMIARLDEMGVSASIPISIRYADKRLEERCIKEVAEKVKEKKFERITVNDFKRRNRDYYDYGKKEDDNDDCPEWLKEYRKRNYGYSPTGFPDPYNKQTITERTKAETARKVTDRLLRGFTRGKDGIYRRAEHTTKQSSGYNKPRNNDATKTRGNDAYVKSNGSNKNYPSTYNSKPEFEKALRSRGYEKVNGVWRVANRSREHRKLLSYNNSKDGSDKTNNL